ncbi:MAG TPA: lactate utilization protein [Bacillota bacterium]|nr:lactate utilization protein [Bacillota bacterium]
MEDLFLPFKTNAEAIGAKVYRGSSLDEVRQQLGEILHSLKASKVAVARSSIIDRLELDALSGEDLTLNYGNNLGLANAADVGISEVDFGISETGTLGLDSTDITKRLVSSLPLVHIALVREERLIRTFAESIALVNPSGGAGSFTFVTGPSRTSDIERVLTIGVHGPEELHIIVVNEAN